MSESSLGLLLLWAGLVVLLTGGTRWLQGTLYSEPAAGLGWRGPVCATLLAALVGLWGYLDSHPPGRYSSLFNFSPSDVREYRRLRAVLRKDGREVTIAYLLRKNAQGMSEYREEASPHRPLPRHPEAIIVEDNGREDRFEPERQRDKSLKVLSGQSLRYVDAQGRVMSDDQLGSVATFYWGRFLTYLLLNLGHLALWFLCLWLMLHFQWSHALGLAVVAWLTMTILVVPLWLNGVEQRAGQSPSSLSARSRSLTGCA